MTTAKIAAACAAAALLAAGPAAADLCTIEATPAATLLLPYFEVDIDDPNGIDTFMSLNNALPFSVLGHVVVWTDMSVEALDFNIYLTGYDVQTIGLGLIIRNGILPATSADDSPVGAFSVDVFPAGDYSACESVLPYELPALDEEFLAHLQSILTGGPSSSATGKHRSGRSSAPAPTARPPAPPTPKAGAPKPPSPETRDSPRARRSEGLSRRSEAERALHRAW